MRYLTVAVIACVAACTSPEPISYSAPVGITMKARSNAVTAGVIADEKNINTESGNPYGAFVANAQAALGHDPSTIDVKGIQVAVDASSTGVTMLGEVFTGMLELAFEMDASVRYTVARAPVTTTTMASTTIVTDFGGDDVSMADYAKMVAGGFKVMMNAPAAAGFEAKSADATIVVTFTFAAYE